MPSDKERIALLEYRVEELEKMVKSVSAGFLRLSGIIDEQAKEEVKESLTLIAIVSVLSKEIPTFGEKLGQTLEAMSSDIKTARS